VKRGDLVTVALPGDYGKPRPAVVVQSDNLPQTDSVMLCLTTSTLRGLPLYRLAIAPSAANNLRRPTEIMADKVMTARRDRVGAVIGRLSDAELLVLNRMLAFALGLGDASAAAPREGAQP
jgi:mRNA interferase MazF